MNRDIGVTVETSNALFTQVLTIGQWSYCCWRWWWWWWWHLWIINNQSIVLMGSLLRCSFHTNYDPDRVSDRANLHWRSATTLWQWGLHIDIIPVNFEIIISDASNTQISDASMYTQIYTQISHITLISHLIPRFLTHLTLRLTWFRSTLPDQERPWVSSTGPLITRISCVITTKLIFDFTGLLQGRRKDWFQKCWKGAFSSY